MKNVNQNQKIHLTFEPLAYLAIAFNEGEAPHYIKTYLEHRCSQIYVKAKADEAKKAELIDNKDKDAYSSVYDEEVLFTTQDNLNDKLKSHFMLEKKLFQSSISRALKRLLAYNLVDSDKKEYGIVKFGGSYYLRPRAVAGEMVPLYLAKNIFREESVHRLSDTTLVFKLIKDSKHLKEFMKILKASLPQRLFWGFSRQGTYLYIMFNESYTSYSKYYNAFLHFFEKRAEYRLKEKISSNIRRVTRKKDDIFKL